MASNRYVVTDIPSSFGFSSIATPAAQLSFVQLPSILCDEIILSLTTADIALSNSATPGTNYLPIKTSGTSPGQVIIQTGGNSANLYIANNSTAVAQTVSFMYKVYPKGA